MRDEEEEDTVPELWNKWKKKYWPPKKDQLLILVLSGLLLAVAAIPADRGRAKAGVQQEPASQAQTEGKYTDGDYEERMEQKLQEMLSQVEGVGAVQVMLTFEGTGEKQVEKDQTVSESSSQEETVFEEEGGSVRTPYVTSETNPRVEGVLVIAEGGGSSRVQQEILEAAQALFGIEAHKIKIMKMEGSK